MADPQQQINDQNVYIRDTLLSIAAKYAETLKDAVESAFDNVDATVLQNVGKDVVRTFNKLAKLSDDFALNQNRIKKGLLSQKDIEKQINSIQEKREILERKIEHARRLGVQLSEADHAAALESLRVQELQLEVDKKLAKSQSGRYALKKVSDDLGKQFRLDEIKEMFTLVGILKIMIDSALRFNKISVEIGKSLGYGADKADALTNQMTHIARNSSNLNVTLANVAEAMSQINDSTGLTAEYSADTLKTQIMLTKQFGLTADEAAGIYQYSVLTGEATSKVNEKMVKAFVASRNTLRVGADFRKTMAEASKVSGQLAANLGYNPERITKAVVAMKAFGTTLEQTKSQGEALLNWESSIENELKAELITGEKMNLERARYAALTGDVVGLAEELTNQGMTLEKFSSMNVIAQKSYAEALGLSADQLSEQLKKQKIAQEQGKSLAQLTEEEAIEAEKRQNVQDKFNAAILKLQDLIGGLVAGPFGVLLDVLSQALDLVSALFYPFKLIYDMTSYIGNAIGGLIDKLGIVGKILKGLAGIAIVWAAYKAYASLAAIPVIGVGLGAVAAAGITAAGFGLLNSQKVGDLVSPADGKTQVSTKEGGLFELSKNDDLIAGPGLAGKVRGGGSMDLSPMIAAINEVRNAVNNLAAKSNDVVIDGQKIGKQLGATKALGSSQIQNSYKLA